jgi:hypothetical protein
MLHLRWRLRSVLSISLGNIAAKIIHQKESISLPISFEDTFTNGQIK